MEQRTKQRRGEHGVAGCTLCYRWYPSVLSGTLVVLERTEGTGQRLSPSFVYKGAYSHGNNSYPHFCLPQTLVCCFGAVPRGFLDCCLWRECHSHLIFVVTDDLL